VGADLAGGGSRQPCRGRDEQGYIGIFLLMMIPVFVMIAGLVFDGGNTIAAKRRAVDEAQSAARAGAEQLSLALQQGGFTLDAPQAVAAAQAVLAQAGLSGDVQVSGDVVTVTVRTTYQSALLPTSFEVVGTGTAQPVRGVTRVVSGG
jgi:Flp pilus assembly protein TadG